MEADDVYLTCPQMWVVEDRGQRDTTSLVHLPHVTNEKDPRRPLRVKCWWETSVQDVNTRAVVRTYKASETMMSWGKENVIYLMSLNIHPGY